MKTIRTRVRVGQDGTLTLRVPADVAPGEWDAVLVLDAAGTAARQQAARAALRELGPLRVPGWVAERSISRDDLYDDTARP